MKVSRDEIEAKRTANGGFTAATLAAWGVPWPPPKGWMKFLITGTADPVDFLETNEWKELRYSILQRDGFRCTVCGRDVGDGVKLQVDHLKPRSLYPELEKDPGNLATKCADCNHGKGQKAA
jgi:hypothetical protein